MTAMPMPPVSFPGPAAGLPLSPSADAATDVADQEVASLSPEDKEPAVSVVRAPVRVPPAIRILLVEELEQVSERVRELLRSGAGMELVQTLCDGEGAVARIAEMHPDVVIIDALLQGRIGGLQVARQVREAGMATPIVFLTVPERPLRLGPELGLAEALTLPLDGDSLRGAISSLDRAHRGPVVLPPTGTVAVFSAKGGVGCTTVAHDLAVALGQRPDTRVVLVDGDIVHGDLRLHLAAPESAPSLLQLPTGQVRETDVAPLVWRAGSGVDVLLAPPRMEQAELIMLSDLRSALSVLRRLYDVVVIDVPAVMNDTTLALLDDADVIVDIVTPEPGAAEKARRCRVALEAAAFPTHKIMTVVNRAVDGRASAELEALLGRPVDVTLPLEPSLADVRSPLGASVVAARPGAPLGRAFTGLATMVAGRLTTNSEAVDLAA